MLRIFRAIVLACLLPNLAAAQTVTLTADGASETVLAMLQSASLSLSTSEIDDAQPQDFVAAARADYRRLLTALYASGYYGGTISIKLDGREAATLAPLDAPARITTITIDVTKGPRFRFGQAQIAPLASGTALPETFATGRIARSDVIKDATRSATATWRDQGYAKVRAAGQQIVAQHGENVLGVAVAIDTGPQLTFGPLTVSGNQDVRSKQIARIAGLPTGAIYSPADIAKSEQRLRRTGAFDSVAIVESPTIGPDNTLPVTVQVVESKPRRFGFGLELSSIEGLTVSSFWLHRNFLGGAERFRVDGEVSGIGGETGGTDYRLALDFNRPASFGPDTNFFVTAELSRQDEPDYLVDKASVELGYTRILRDDLTVSGGAGLLTAREETADGVRSYTLLTFPFSGTLDRRDDPANASNGYYLDLDLTPFVGLLDSESGARMFADARGYRSFGEGDKFTLAARAQIGAVFGPGIDQTPADFLFYSGGGGTVRGQDYKSLGIDSTSGGGTIRTGGLSFAGAQIEARTKVNDKIGIVGFYDFGQVSATSNPFENGADWHAGAGIGVRYNTGIGPIRLDIATPASGDEAGKQVQVYIGIGQSF